MAADATKPCECKRDCLALNEAARQLGIAPLGRCEACEAELRRACEELGINLNPR